MKVGAGRVRRSVQLGIVVRGCLRTLLAFSLETVVTRAFGVSVGGSNVPVWCFVWRHQRTHFGVYSGDGKPWPAVMPMLPVVVRCKGDIIDIHNNCFFFRARRQRRRHKRYFEGYTWVRDNPMLSLFAFVREYGVYQ